MNQQDCHVLAYSHRKMGVASFLYCIHRAAINSLTVTFLAIHWYVVIAGPVVDLP